MKRDAIDIKDKIIIIFLFLVIQFIIVIQF